jgi:XTP/dITP diphosphohydrolase/ATP diphosphatase
MYFSIGASGKVNPMAPVHPKRTNEQRHTSPAAVSECQEAVEAAAPLAESIAIMARLRGPGGCPWDCEQTFDSIKKHTLEETYEVFDAIERRAWPDLRDELGDLLLQVLFYAQMASEAGYFSLADVAANLNAKLIRRHPHIFGDVEAADAGAVLRNWEQIKQEEKKAVEDSAAPRPMLDDIPRSMPALLEANKLGSRAAKVGFDWPDTAGLFEKIHEEIGELKAELKSEPISVHDRIEEEFGDLLFTAVNLARHLKLDPESALRAANAKFRRRFNVMESAAGGRHGLEVRSAAELEALWSQAKQRETKDDTA